MNYTIERAAKFKKQMKKLSVDKKYEVLAVLNKLANGEILDEKYKDHKLSGEYQQCRECHVRPDLLLIYQKKDDVLILLCVAVGSHSDLFG
ncbi:type II toxin-antitoxin system mRNA interferase toxin, RelE/StbE family [Helicobacter saguini]|uniref:Type II toxin-antitoxin system YafQ family toxin n=1 Tax=Helicobacter saguini TaxID=1548018 RepID=A0A347VP19_9HELI|nr:type II toxin-antitoxin system YafQ family toxin [Helicobacter saguini]MWV61545.1 type II toxin-antitoxin system mRNA interferase toxin, RelE/StbE family [Helicobacter saguini]MWV67785.1 type II toxin-antitoxin system mRNA interferase toxin, RelE/StbE family [Helicobacter saguini]MWV70747.1 type II toxin-antitoxin system mRNA interferase toxin, RelE/StbE family [Helicobacter saguini]MWV72651.1 type II toxin-antitoxin system mRNA interferase toxin, RelE/StbE family [Helicobacter saguini]TLD9